MAKSLKLNEIAACGVKMPRLLHALNVEDGHGVAVFAYNINMRSV